MQLNFTYSRDKDIWCLLNKGKGSNNSSKPTKVYEFLVSKYGENPTEEETSQFIDSYLEKNNVSLDDFIKQYSTDWESVADEYHKRAESIFGTSLPEDITTYLSVNNRNPYSIFDNMFYVTVPRETVRKTILHELWHFYTWYGLGADQEEKLGKQKYNEIKESLTVLLNEECSDLMPEGVFDEGYPQHKELREEIKRLWREQKDIRLVWNEVSSR